MGAYPGGWQSDHRCASQVATLLSTPSREIGWKLPWGWELIPLLFPLQWHSAQFEGQVE